MKEISFVKMHGAGNDFVLIDDRDGSFPMEGRKIAMMATRRIGIGCEGVIFVQKSEQADFKMRFFNPDGTEVELCGNGARCVAAFARSIGAATSDKMRFETLAGIIDAEVLSERLVRIKMPDPKNIREDFCVVGVPHKIVSVENLAKVDVYTDGRTIRLDPEFAPEGTNVDFVSFKAPDRLSIRTYERGVEAETGACGTGAVASAVIGVLDYGLDFPVKVSTSHGFELIIEGKRTDEGKVEDLYLTGPVEKVYKGIIDYDSLTSSDLV